jgi:hypothetical protein
VNEQHAQEYRGVRLHDGQSPERLRTVKKDIDLVLALAAIDAFERLYGLTFDARASPEARLHAAELVRGAVAEGRASAGFDLEVMDRAVARRDQGR